MPSCASLSACARCDATWPSSAADKLTAPSMAGAIAARPSSTLRLFESWPQLFGESKNALFHTDPELLRTEVEISPRGDDGCRSHKAVLRRRAGEYELCALV